jgi:hypothetical protein
LGQWRGNESRKTCPPGQFQRPFVREDRAVERSTAAKLTARFCLGGVSRQCPAARESGPGFDVTLCFFGGESVIRTRDLRIMILNQRITQNNCAQTKTKESTRNASAVVAECAGLRLFFGRQCPASVPWKEGSPRPRFRSLGPFPVPGPPAPFAGDLPPEMRGRGGDLQIFPFVEYAHTSPPSRAGSLYQCRATPAQR